MTTYIEVRTTTDSRDSAMLIAQTIVTKRLAACVQVSGPITSTYWWQGKIEQAEEWLCAAKTREDHYQALEQAIKAAHTYEEPEILATAIVTGSAGYLAWIERETTS